MFLVSDIGGTKMRLALSPDGRRLGESKILSTPQNFAEAVDLICSSAGERNTEERVSAAVLGVAGLLDQGKKSLLAAPHLSGWANQPLQQILAERLGCPVYLENDTALVGLAEATMGAGRSSKILAYLTVSTGVGGARIVAGNIDRHTLGFEPGHQIINFQGRWQTLEECISGSALQKRLGVKPEAVKDKRVWQELARLLAYGLYNTILHWSPDTVVVGGSMINQPGIDLVLTERYLQEIQGFQLPWPAIRPAALGERGGLSGALVYLRQKIAE